MQTTTTPPHPFRPTCLRFIPATAGMLALISGISQAAVLDLGVSSALKQIVGTSSSTSSAPSNSNYNSGTAVGDFAVFRMSDSTLTTTYDLRVTYLRDDSGTVGSKLMVARTTTSQAITDNKTISIFLTPSSGANPGTVTLQFDWFAGGAYDDNSFAGDSVLPSAEFIYRTFDIDVNQTFSMLESDVASVTLDGSTKLHRSDVDFGGDTWTEVHDNNEPNATTIVPELASTYQTTNDLASHQIRLGYQTGTTNGAVFVLEFSQVSNLVTFNNPTTESVTPSVSAVPEPSGSIALGGLLLGSAFLRRRIRR